MTQSLINISIIWLVSLIAYEVLLKRTTFHAMNRAYLLITLVIGIVLPLLPWQEKVNINIDNNTSPVSIASIENNTKPNILSPIAKEPTASSFDWLFWMYISGIIVSIILLCIEFSKMILFYYKANKKQVGAWTIAETNRSHTPFSFLKIIFVSKQSDYNEQQWNMVLHHEQQHYYKKHIIDLLLIQIAQIIFWFHPLIYIYRYKLQLIHEYEVDSEQTEDKQAYGHFLIEQAILPKAPQITHSFIFPSLKNRIVMLTKPSSQSRVRVRLLIIVPLLASFFFCCAKNTPSKNIEIKENHVTVSGNKMGFPGPSYDTVFIENPATGERQMKVTKFFPLVDSLNGEKIMSKKEVLEEPKVLNSKGNSNILEGLIKESKLQGIFEKMKDADYSFSLQEMVVNKAGKLVYYTVNMPDGFTQAKAGERSKFFKGEINEQDQIIMHNSIANFLLESKIHFSAAKDKNGQTVIGFLPEELFYVEFSISNHKLSFKK